MPILGEGERDFAQMSFAQMSLRANVTQPLSTLLYEFDKFAIQTTRPLQIKPAIYIFFLCNRYSLFKYEPLITFAKMVGYDAFGLGNHDFDDGVEGLVPFIEGVDFPVLAANIVRMAISISCICRTKVS